MKQIKGDEIITLFCIFKGLIVNIFLNSCYSWSMKIAAASISFSGRPNNYANIDQYVSRSAQPAKEDFAWLKAQGVTDIINFRTMYQSGMNFDEKKVVENLGMKYHNIPTYSRTPKEENILKFLKITNKVIEEGGKIHIHCKAGADRTGLNAFIYKMSKGIGTLRENIDEWIFRGHNTKLYPDMIPWAKNFVSKNFK